MQTQGVVCGLMYAIDMHRSLFPTVVGRYSMSTFFKFPKGAGRFGVPYPSPLGTYGDPEI